MVEHTQTSDNSEEAESPMIEPAVAAAVAAVVESVAEANTDTAPETVTETVPEAEAKTVTAAKPVQRDIPDYSAYDRPALVERLRVLADTDDVESVRDEVDLIKFYFYKKLIAEQESRAAEEAAEDKHSTRDSDNDEQDELELALKALLNKYRDARTALREQQEAEKQHNLEAKLQIIEELKDLSNKGDTIGENFQAFRSLQDRWKAIGLVPQTAVKDLWETYHHYVESFYDFIKINKELRDLDFKRNLESKIALCEKAEALVEGKSIVEAFRALQDLHDQWREIGPVPQEMRTEIWERFKAASTAINKKHQSFFDELKESQQRNLEAKEAIITRLEAMMQKQPSSMSQWEKASKAIVDIQQKWNAIGFAPKKDNNKITKRFHNICDDFFNRKRDFFKAEKIVQDENLRAKEALCQQVEAVQDSTDWKATTDIIIGLQQQWKEIGNVPARYREPVWRRFRAACDKFFTEKAKHFSSVDSEYDNNLKAKRDLIERIKTFEPSDTRDESFERLKALQAEWNSIGYVPFKYMKKVQEEYRVAINEKFEALQLDRKKSNVQRFKSKVERMAASAPPRKIESERDKLLKRHKQLQSDLIIWENNIGFISKSKNAETMIASVQRMIEDGKREIAELEEKIKLIDQIN